MNSLLKIRWYESAQNIPFFLLAFIHDPWKLFSWSNLLLIIIVFSISLLAYTFNDYIDYEQDLNNPRKTPLPKAFNGTISLIFCLIPLLGFFWVSTEQFYLILVQLVLVLLYSLNHLKSMNLPFFSLFIHFTTAVLFNLMGQLEALTKIQWELALICGLLFVIGNLLSQVFDYQVDGDFKLRNFTTLFGVKVNTHLQVLLNLVITFILFNQFNSFIVLILGIVFSTWLIILFSKRSFVHLAQKSYRYFYASIFVFLGIISVI